MDAVFYYLQEAEQCINKMQDVSLFDCVFEAAKSDKLEIKQEVINVEMGEKSVNLLEKAIAGIKKVFEQIKKIFSNIVDYLKLSPDDKRMYDEFAQKCKEDPEFAGKKVTVKNWKAIDKEYDDIIGKLEKEILELEKEKDENRPDVLKELEKQIQGLGPKVKTYAIQITLDQMMTRAKYDASYALILKDRLDNNYSLLNRLTRELGKKELRKNRRKLFFMTRQSRILRALAGVRKQQLDLHKQAMIEERAMVNSFWKSIVKGSWKTNDFKTFVKGTGRVGYDVLKQTGNEVGTGWRFRRKLARSERRMARKNKRFRKRYDTITRDQNRHTREEIDREKNKIFADRLRGKY